MKNRTALLLAGVFCLLVCEFLLFRTYVLRELEGNFPRGQDQSAYLERAYYFHEAILSQGPFKAFVEELFGPHPQGIMQVLQVEMVFALFGPSRLSSLSLGFFYFAVLQILFVVVVRDIKNSGFLAMAGLGVILSLGSLALHAGDLFDFRLDFTALCLYGCWCLSVLRSRIFQDRVWTGVSLLFAVDLILFRFITVVYLGCILTTLLLLMAFFWRRESRRKSASALEWQRRFLNLLFSGLGIVACCAVFFWIQRKALYLYYGLGHLLGSEKEIREREMNIFSWWDSLVYYPYSLFRDHLGSGCLILLLVTALIAFVPGLGTKKISSRFILREKALEIAFLAMAILFPLLILLCDRSKSPVVGGIVTIPCILIFFRMLPEGDGKGAIFPRVLAGALSVGVLGLGLGNFLQHSAWERSEGRTSGLFPEVNALYDTFSRHLKVSGLSSTRVAFNSVYEFARIPAISAWNYENRGSLLVLQSTLGETIFATSLQESIGGLKQAQFILLGEPPAENQVYPFHESMREYFPEMEKWCRQNSIRLGEFKINGLNFYLFGNLNAWDFQNKPGGWITPEGFSLSGGGYLLSRSAKLKLEGRYFDKMLAQSPSFRAFLKIPGRTDQELKVSFAGKDGLYELAFLIPSIDVPTDLPIRIEVEVKGSFVPKEMGINGDPRRLTLMDPSRIDVDLL